MMALKAACLLLIATLPVFGQSSLAEPYQIRISPNVAEKLLIHKVDPSPPKCDMCARVRGTVVVDIEIDRAGRVGFRKIISGPLMLLRPVLDAVRQYIYKPYMIQGKPMPVETTAPVTVDLE